MTPSAVAPFRHLCLLLLSSLALLGAVSAQSPSDCPVMLGDLDLNDFAQGESIIVLWANSTYLFNYTTGTGPTPLVVTHLAVTLFFQPGPLLFQVALYDSGAKLLTQAAAPISIDSDLVEGGYSAPLPAPYTLQPSTQYYIALLPFTNLAYSLQSVPNAPIYEPTPYDLGFPAQYNISDASYYGANGPAAAVNCAIDSPESSTGSSSVIGDPQFVGLLGQSYQVHGVDGQVYNLVSDKFAQINAKLSFLDAGACDRDERTGAPLYTCWTHPGTYLTQLGLLTAASDTVVVTAGAGLHGFQALLVNGEDVLVSTNASAVWPATLRSVDGTLPALSIRLFDRRTLAIDNAGLYSLTLQNSDGFLNIVSLTVSSMSRLARQVQSHGLIGQTWQRRTDGAEVAVLEGRVDDYVEVNEALLGCAFVFNKFHCEQSADVAAPLEIDTTWAAYKHQA